MRNPYFLCRITLLFGALVSTGNAQVIHSGEEIFVINLTGGVRVQFHGSALVTGVDGASTESKLVGAVPAEFRVTGTAVYLTVQNGAPGDSRELEIRLNSKSEPELDTGSGAMKSGAFLASGSLHVAIREASGPGSEAETSAPFGIASTTYRIH